MTSNFHIVPVTRCYLHKGDWIVTAKSEVLSFFSLITVQGVANRGASIRVGRDTEKAGKGYFEDRRPASNMDPYVVTSMIAETTILWKP